MTPAYLAEALEQVGVQLIRHAWDAPADRAIAIDAALARLGFLRSELAAESAVPAGGGTAL